MSRDIPTEFSPFAPNLIGTGRKIDREQESKILSQNPHYLYAYSRPIQISTMFRSNTGTGVGEGLEGASTSRLDALWMIEPPGEPFTHWRIYALVKNLNPSTAGTLRFELVSDPYPGTDVDISIPAGASQWTEVSGRIAIDNTQSIDVLRMSAINAAGSTGVQLVLVHSVMVIPEAVATIPAGVNTQSGYPFVPTDSSEVAVDRPLSVRLRNRAHANLMHIYRNRPGMCVTFAEALYLPFAANEGLHSTSNEYETVARVPIFVPKGTTSLRWSLLGDIRGSNPGNVRLHTATMDNKGDAAQVIPVASATVSPFTSDFVNYAVTGYDVLKVYPSEVHAVSQDELIVDIQGNGQTCSIKSLCVWFEKVTG